MSKDTGKARKNEITLKWLGRRPKQGETYKTKFNIGKICFFTLLILFIPNIGQNCGINDDKPFMI